MKIIDICYTTFGNLSKTWGNTQNIGQNQPTKKFSKTERYLVALLKISITGRTCFIRLFKTTENIEQNSANFRCNIKNHGAKLSEILLHSLKTRKWSETRRHLAWAEIIWYNKVACQELKQSHMSLNNPSLR